MLVIFDEIMNGGFLKKSRCLLCTTSPGIRINLVGRAAAGVLETLLILFCHKIRVYDNMRHVSK